MRPVLVAPILFLLAGCATEPPAPTPDPTALPRTVTRIQRLTGEMFDALDAGQPKDADEPLHKVGHALTDLKKLGTQLLDQKSNQRLDDAVEELLTAYAKLHEPMHLAEFPEDFDAEPIREEIEAGLESLIAALPARFAAETPPADAGASRAGRIPALLVSRRAAAPAPVCPTVMMYDAHTMRIAPQLVDRVAEIHGDAVPKSARWVQFVPTIHARLNKDLTPGAYGVQQSRARSWTAPANFEAMSDALAERCRGWIDAAVGRAVTQRLHLAVLPHLDPAGGPVVEWRNHYDYRPRGDVGGYSYWSLLLAPLADAIERHATPETRVDFCLSGEMGEGLFRYPGEHLDVLRELRERFAANPNTAGVRLGIGLNWGGLAGRVDPADIDRAAAQAFFDGCDFVGYSCYTPVSNPPTPADFEAATDKVLAELRDLGVELDASTPLLFTEVGLGGGAPKRADDGTVRPPTPDEAAAEPWAGRGSGRFRPWQDEALAEFRWRYHETLCEYLRSPAAARVERVFFWSEGPWDPQGVIDTLHRDQAIADLIARHNGR